VIGSVKPTVVTSARLVAAHEHRKIRGFHDGVLQVGLKESNLAALSPVMLSSAEEITPTV
jgi:hypothetical protein